MNKSDLQNECIKLTTQLANVLVEIINENQELNSDIMELKSRIYHLEDCAFSMGFKVGQKVMFNNKAIKELKISETYGDVKFKIVKLEKYVDDTLREINFISRNEYAIATVQDDFGFCESYDTRWLV